ncbi:MAG: class I SAM-dependent methyltransferase [Patescibacteria group bacterium]
MFYWEEKARKNPKIRTSPDIGCDILEKSFITKFLKKDQTVLDAGSGDGKATAYFALKVKKIIALEPSKTLLEGSKRIFKRKKIKNIETIEGSIFDLKTKLSNKKFDVVITKRVLINLINWTKQKQAITEIAATLPTGGLYLLTEGFEDTFNNLQRIRIRYGLSKDHIVKYNHYLDRKKFEKEILKYFSIVDQNNLGIYYFLSHFYYPLYIKPKKPKYNSKFNKIAVQIGLKEKILEEFGYINFYALKRK